MHGESHPETHWISLLLLAPEFRSETLLDWLTRLESACFDATESDLEQKLLYSSSLGETDAIVVWLTKTPSAPIDLLPLFSWCSAG